MLPRRALLVIGVIAAAVLAGCGGSGHHHAGAATGISTSSGPASPYAGMVPPAPLDVGALSLPDAADDGRPLALHAAPGGLLLVFFGFTHCEDVCPLTMAELRSAVAALPAADRPRIRVAFVTVDPKRDTAAVLTGYVRGFFPSGAALRSEDDAALRAVATAFSAAYDVRRGDGGDVEVLHTDFVYAVDADGRVVVQWPYGTPTADITADLGAILAATPAS